MNWSRFRCLSVAPFGLGVSLLMGLGAMGAQAPGGPPATRQEPVPERDRLIRQAEELRQAGKLDEAVAAAERALELERRAGGEASPREAEALARLAELHELRGDWVEAVGRRKEALAIRVQVDGKEHWRTADTRLALAFAEKVAGLGQADRARLGGALRREQEAARLEEQGKCAEAERVALEALETYRALVGPESAEVARVWHRIGRCRSARNDAGGAKEANERALMIRRKVLPGTHPDLGRSLNNLGLVESSLGNRRRAREFLEEAVRLWGSSLESSSPLTALGLNNLGVVQYELGEYAAAKQTHEQVLAIRRNSLPKDHPDIATSLNNLGVVQSALREYAAAKQSHEQALAIRRKSLPPDDPLIASSLNNLGNVQRELGEYAAAKQSDEQALAIFHKSLPPDHPDIAQCLNNLGMVQDKLREYPAAKQSLEQALSIRRKSLPPDHPDIASSLNNLGMVQDELREYAAAKQSDEQALAIYRKSLPKDHPDIAHSLNNLGMVQDELREYAAAKQSYQEALAIFRKSLPSDHPDIATSLNNLGTLQSKLREYAAAKQSLEQALAIWRKSLPPDHPDIATSLNNLGLVQSELREYAAAKQSHEQALAIRRKSLPKDHPDIAQSLHNLGTVHYELREYAAAKQCYQEALAIRRKSLPPDHPRIADSLNNLANVQSELREYAAAKQSLEQALAIFRKSLSPDQPDIATSLNNLGLVQSELREYAAAKQSLEQALAIRRKSLPPDHPRIADSLDNLGLVQDELREYAAAKQSHEQALAIFRKSLPKDHPDIAICLRLLGLQGLKSGVGVGDAFPRLAEATDLFQAEQLRLAVAQAEQEQLATAALARRSLGNLLSATLITRAEPASAYDRVVRVKGSVTAQQRWARQARDAADPDTTRLLDRLRQVTRQIVGLSMDNRSAQSKSDSRDVPDEIRTLSAEREELERQLTERSEVYRTTIQARARVGSGEVRAALPEGSALVDLVDYFHMGPPAKGQTEPSAERRMVAFVVRPERQEVVIVPLGSSRALAKWINRWRASYGAGKVPPAGETDPGAELRKRLWEPLAEHLQAVSVVLVSPDGPLNGLPWAALPGSKEGTFLVHEYAFAVVPVPQLLPELLRGKPRLANQQPSLLLAGGIDFGKAKARDPKAEDGKLPPLPFFKPLPGTESEVNDLCPQFKDAYPGVPEPELLRKDKATKQAILAAAPLNRFVHLATHGFFAVESEKSAVDVLHLRPEAVGRHPGLLSGVVFAGVNRKDRRPEETILTALEAAELDLDKVELLVLSACETGLGQVSGGEGVLGLQRAFQLAGARAVVASLWKVDDEEAHLFMREFYRQVWTDKPVSRGEALRQAQLWMLENRKGRGLERPERPQGPPSPCIWAAFVLSGDWR